MSEHALELLDEPGEWYLDRKTGRLYYWPLPGETRDRADAFVAALPHLVRFEGKPEAKRYVEHVHLRGLSFRQAVVTRALQRLGMMDSVPGPDAPLPDLSNAEVATPADASRYRSILFRLPDDLSTHGDNWVFVDLASGGIIGEKIDRTSRAGDRLLTWIFPLHTGVAFGLPGRRDG